MSFVEPLLLSICVPTYNRQFMLERNVNFHLDAFRSLGVPFEIVLVDDCSTDETPAYIQSIAHNPEISAYRRAANSGFLSNYAYAMQRARGRYAVFLGDDDLLIPEKVLEYIRLMEADPRIGVVQAPWMLVDGRPGGGDMGPFYKIPQQTRHEKGNFRSLLDFILKYHVFPEFMIIRRDVLSMSISSPAPFIFWAFLYTTRALDKADILFTPEPFARVTAVSDDPRLQQGNKECMFQWDTYRGGLEYLASHAALLQEDRARLVESVNRFMLIRQGVALRLHVQAKNWVEAYVMYHRMAAYQPAPLAPDLYGLTCKMAGIVTAANEASNFNEAPVVVDPAILNETLGFLPVSIQKRLTRELPAPDQRTPTAWLRLSPEFPPNPHPKDAIFDLANYISQFV